MTFKAAFMGYRPEDRGHLAIGYKFAEEIKPGDIVLVARRHHKKPDIVGFGVVKGKSKRRLEPTEPARQSLLGIEKAAQSEARTLSVGSNIPMQSFRETARIV